MLLVARTRHRLLGDSMLVNLWNHQQEAVSKFLADGYLFCIHEVGTGKTRTSIECIQRKNLTRGLILCPLIVCENWRREINNWAPELQDRVKVLGGSQKKRIKDLDASASIFVTNHEAVIMKDLWAKILSMPWEFLLIDESHRFKNPQAARTRTIMTLAEKIKHKILLTGTPMLQSVIDLQPQLRILNNKLVPKNWYEFRARYCMDLNKNMPKSHYFPNWQPRPETAQELNNIVSLVAHRAEKKEVLKDLPPFVRQVVYVDLEKETKKIYQQMESSFITELDGETMHADLVLTKLIRLQQITAGIFKNDKGEEKSLPTPKLAALAELLSDNAQRHKVIVWANFIHCYHDIAAVCTQLELPSVIIRGEQSPKDRQIAVDAFQQDPSVRVCIANQAAGGIGINLHAASIAIYYSKGFGLEHDLQSEARCYRGGSEVHQKVTRIDILAKDTIDEDIHVALRDKLALSDLITKIKRGRYGD